MGNKLTDLARGTLAPPPKTAEAPALAAEVADAPKSNRRPATFHIDQDLTREVKDAVIHLAGAPAFMSLSLLVEQALAAELERLAKEYNKGAPFPPAPPQARLKVGRPMARS